MDRGGGRGRCFCLPVDTALDGTSTGLWMRVGYDTFHSGNSRVPRKKSAVLATRIFTHEGGGRRTKETYQAW